jgi:23S rRNA pseudouridine1911/1915/1917 synthase
MEGVARFRTEKQTRLIEYLAEKGISRTKIKQLLKHRAIEVNGKEVMRPDHGLIKGDSVAVRKDKKRPATVPSSGIKIVFEDSVLIVIEKPAGLLSIASEKEKTRTAYYLINKFLRERDPGARERVFIVHRLDQGTSGLIVFAKNEAAKRTLQGNWKRAEKKYYAVVEGIPRKIEGEIASSLSETRTLRVYSNRGSGSENGNPSVTHYRLLHTAGEYSLLDILLKTGRKNQIRVHLADIGHPVAGDRKYGARTDPLRRLGLHAYLLSIPHPLAGKLLMFESALPADFGRLFTRK